jgi:hypothetical protein
MIGWVRQGKASTVVEGVAGWCACSTEWREWVTFILRGRNGEALSARPAKRPLRAQSELARGKGLDKPLLPTRGRLPT